MDLIAYLKGCRELHLKKILVTDGNIGRHVAEGLAKKGVLVRLLVRSFTPNTGWESLGIEQVEGDMSNIDSLAASFEGVDRFFSVTPYVENLVELGINAIEAAKRAGVTYIVRSSMMHIGAVNPAALAKGDKGSRSAFAILGT